MVRSVKGGKRVAAILARPDKEAVKDGVKKRYTLYLSKRNYEALVKICDRKGATTSELIDNIIADLLDSIP